MLGFKLCQSMDLFIDCQKLALVSYFFLFHFNHLKQFFYAYKRKKIIEEKRIGVWFDFVMNSVGSRLFLLHSIRHICWLFCSVMYIIRRLKIKSSSLWCIEMQSGLMLFCEVFRNKMSVKKWNKDCSLFIYLKSMPF